MIVATETETRRRVLEACRGLEALVREAEDLGGAGERSLENWKALLRELPGRLEEGILRAAVVGPIKSGKSTFLNCLLGEEILKRGAGVVTSIITRIRRGERREAHLLFKTWSEVNEEIRQAMILLPGQAERPADGGFDLRRERDRLALGRALSALAVEQRLSEDALDRNLVLLSDYLRGYETVRSVLSEQPAEQRFAGERFLEHWTFSGDEAHAVYLKDIQLKVAGVPSANLEIADCQGSDSPNPLHLAMIQDYLHRAHLLLYVISSRTGLRRADVQFLSMLRRMGILENVLFVVNVDFNEHPTLPELLRLLERVREELSLQVAEPALYAFSALYHLFSRIGERLSPKERKLFEGWQADADMAAWSEREMCRFQEEFDRLLERQAGRLFWQNPVEQLRGIAAGLSRWAAVGGELLGRDAEEVRRLHERLRRRRERFADLGGLLQAALAGAIPQLREELKTDVHRFLDPQSGEVMAALSAFIDGYRFPDAPFSPSPGKPGFSQALYLAYREFKQALDRFIAEQVTPDIVRFVNAAERKIEARLAAVAAPYRGWIEEACEAMQRELEGLGLAFDCPPPDPLPSIAGFLEAAHARMPALSAGIGYPAKMRSEALLRLGVYRVVGKVKKVLKKPEQEGTADLRAFREAMARLRRETREALRFQFTDFRENLKFAHLFRVTDEAARLLAQCFEERLGFYAADFGGIVARLAAVGGRKEETRQRLTRLHDRCRELIPPLEELRLAVSARPA